jgi:4-diphosphocytidyl-2-C-methyl-D-erythritol kinase
LDAINTISETTVEAPAKVNLFLEVVGQRADGYHEIESIFQAISICDVVRIAISEGRGVSISCDVPALEVPENLAVRAAEAFLRETGAEGHVRVTLEKAIPVQAGLGGGSSDAAAVLVGLNRLTGKALTTDELRGIGAGVGSDVPFFIEGGTALVRGRGERLETMDLRRRLHFVVFFPGFGLSTAAVYKNLRMKLTGEKRNAKVFWDLLSTGRMEGAENHLFNRLEQTAVTLDDRLRVLKSQMHGIIGGRVMVSGSGASLFSVFADEHIASGAYCALKAKIHGEVFLARSVGRRAPVVHPKGDNCGDLRG